MKKLIIFLLFLGFSFGQEKTFEKLSSEIIQEHEKNIQFFEDFRKEISDDEIQSWNESGEFFQSFYDNGNKKFESYSVYIEQIDKEKYHGTVKFHGEDGILLWEMTYMVGNRHGPEKSYHPNGQISVSSYNFQNVPYGPMITFSKEGKIKGSFGYYKKFSFKKNGPTIKYYPNGNIESEIYFKEDVYHGPYKIYYENGQLKDETNYFNNKPFGPYRFYYDNGQIEEEGTFKNGKMDGINKLYYENGQLLGNRIFKNGQLNGPYKMYHQNGQLFGEGTLKDSKRNGPYKEYYENGNLKSEGTYKDGELIESKEY